MSWNRMAAGVAGACLCAALTSAQEAKPPVRWVDPHPSHHNKTRFGNSIRYIVIHTIEGSAGSGVNTFRYSKRRVSAHFIIGRDGAITQMLQEGWTGWHANNQRVNRQSIGFEHGGFADRNTWTMGQYRASARLARYLCDKYGIPKDRQHIIGHNEVPGASHHDPGRYFDWDLYMRLINEGESPTTVVNHGMAPAEGQVVGRGYVPDGDPLTSGPRSGLKVAWNADGTNQRGARVLLEEVGGNLRYDSGYMHGQNIDEHAVDAALEDGKTYRWQSLVFDGQKTVSSRWITFTTDFTRPDMEAVAPADGGVVAATPILRWRYSDKDGTTQVGYRVQLDDDEDHSKLIADTLELNGDTDHYFVRASLQPGRTYYWRAMGHDGRGNVNYTHWRSFETPADFRDTNSPGLSVRVLTPQGGAALPANERPVLKWAYHNGEQREQQAFRVQVDDDQDSSAYMLDMAYKNPKARGFRANQLQAGDYRWRVGVSDGKDTAWTDWAAFVIRDEEPTTAAAGTPEGQGLTAVLSAAADEIAGEPSAGESAADTAASAETSAETPESEETTGDSEAATDTQVAADSDAADTDATGTDAATDTDAAPASDSTTALTAGAQSGADSTALASSPRPRPRPESLGSDLAPTTVPRPRPRPEPAQTNAPLAVAASAEAPEPQPELPGWAGLHEGLELEGAQIPRQGLANRTLRSVLKLSAEPLGAPRSLAGLDFVGGKASWFGGSRARGRTALTNERLNTLGVPSRPSRAQTQSQPERYYFVAMRWDYATQRGRWWSRQRLLIVNPKTGKAVVVRPVDWGPHTKTGRTMNLSRQALIDLGASTDDELLAAFATPGTSLGPK